jgi:CBS domain-containing protein
MSPENTVLEALQTMHDNHILTLPVCEASGQVVGLVDVMDVVYGCGGADGWRSIFSSTMDSQDDVSDVTSVRSRPESQQIATERPMASLHESSGEHPVSMLRPMKPLLSTDHDSVLNVAQFLTAKRGVAALITNSTGGLAGIVTDTDITRRVVAMGLSPATTEVSNVMTKNPACVATTDSAMDALTIMVENHFRHLPVVDSDRSIIGVIDIAKCLSGAISSLEKAQAKSDNKARETISHIMTQNGVDGTQSAAVQALLGSLVSQAFGNKALPTLRSILTGKPRTVVGPRTSIFEAARAMAENRKAALVVDETTQSLVGIFGFKDMMTRVVAKELDLETNSVSSVMTPNPETVLPDVSVLEALQMMHDHHFLNLPVCDADGTVVGLVDVMDVIHGCGGADGWRSIFSSAMHLRGDDDDDRSVASSSVHSMGRSVKSKLLPVAKKHVSDTTVEKLRPSKPILTDDSSTILAVTQIIKSKRGSASIIITPAGELTGIITDTDITRRVVAKDVDAATTSVAKVMTPNPTCVSLSDSALDALSTMVENRFRHLPVIDSEGSVVGLLDIAKCLNEAISKLEKIQEKNSKSTQDVVSQVVSQQGAGGAQAAALQALLGTLMSQAFGTQSAPTLRSVLAGKPCTIVNPDTSLYDAGRLMAENRKAALVVDEASGELVGIFGFKDMMNRAIAKELPLATTPISEVMTPSPEFMSPENTVLEALQTMHDNHILTLPVCEASGQVVGLVDVMDVIYGCGGADGWRSIFSKAMEIDESTALSVEGSNLAPSSRMFESISRPMAAKVKLPGNIPSTLEFVDNDVSSAMDDRGMSRVFGPEDGSECGDLKGTFKITDSKGRTHRIRCELKRGALATAISEKAEIELDGFQVQYTDEEGDSVVITSDEDVGEAWAAAQKAGNKVVKLDMVFLTKKANGPDSLLLAAGAVSLVAICASAFFVLNRGKK